MRVTLLPEINDLVFWIQGTIFLDRGSFVLGNIHKNGITEWEGILPNDDMYDIWIERPAVKIALKKERLHSNYSSKSINARHWLLNSH